MKIDDGKCHSNYGGEISLEEFMSMGGKTVGVISFMDKRDTEKLKKQVVEFNKTLIE